MAASSVTGKGLGIADKPNIIELSISEMGPLIVDAGVGGGSVALSPSGFSGSVTFAKSLPLSSSNYVITLTTLNGGDAQVTAMTDTNSKFSGFDFTIEEEGTLMYIVVLKGRKP